MAKAISNAAKLRQRIFDHMPAFAVLLYVLRDKEVIDSIASTLSKNDQEIINRLWSEVYEKDTRI